ncbi:MAG: N-acetylneuraminate synthase family protein [Candidatus Hodarchaeota archaeon]
MRSIKIRDAIIGDNNPVYIIAEIGGNFLNFKEAKRLIDLAIDVGANAVKLQTYKAETIASKSAVYDMPNTGHANQFELFKKYEVDFQLHKEIWDYCHEKGICVFSTPSHITDVELLEKLDCPAYKIGSDDAVNIPFLEEVASIGKPIILSTGMCTMNEVRESVSVIVGKGNENIILLHCVTNYPAEPVHINLKCIPAMKAEFDIPIGYSDHTIGIACCIGAAAIGANVLEKHFTHDKNAEGPDHMLSADPEEMRQIIENVRNIENAMGDGVKRPSDGEKTTRINNRKSIVTVRTIPKGTIITKDMIAIKRPGFGIQPKFFPEVVGRMTKTDIKAEEPVLWDYVRDNLPQKIEKG